MSIDGSMALSTDEACAEGKFGKNALYDAIRDGRLKARKLGRKTIILRSDLEAYLKSLPALDLPNNPHTPQCRNRIRWAAANVSAKVSRHSHGLRNLHHYQLPARDAGSDRPDERDHRRVSGHRIPLILRQLYYQLVARTIIENTHREYKRAGSILNDARLAGLVDWSAIEDRTRDLRALPFWSTPEAIIESCAAQYRENLWRTRSAASRSGSRRTRCSA